MAPGAGILGGSAKVVGVTHSLDDGPGWALCSSYAAAVGTEVGVVVNKDMYVAGGVVAVDPARGLVKWSVHLDLTTELTKLVPVWR